MKERISLTGAAETIPANDIKKTEDLICAFWKEHSIRGMIFDMDGVILDSLFIWKDLGIRYLNSLHLTPQPGLSGILFPMSLEEGAAYLQQNYPICKRAEEVEADLQKMLKDFYYDEVELKTGAGDLVRSLKAQGMILEAATSSPGRHIEKALERKGILSCFSRILTCEEVGESKHSPKIYQLAAEDMGLAPEQILVFEDSLYALQTAKKAGFYTVGVYDRDGEPDQERLMAESDLYLRGTDVSVLRK